MIMGSEWKLPCCNFEQAVHFCASCGACITCNSTQGWVAGKAANHSEQAPLHPYLVQPAEATLRVAAHHQHSVLAHRLDQRRLAVGGQVARKLEAACRGGGGHGEVREQSRC